GSGWQLAAITALAVALLVALGQRVPTLRAGLGGVARFAITSVVGLAFLVVRAIQDPTLNWGAATTPSRLVALISRRDFTSAVTGKAGFATRFETLLGGMVRDLGVVAVVIAVCGGIA